MFLKARPIWMAGCSSEMNIFVGFYTRIQAHSNQNVGMKIACCDYYKLYINGAFAACGPARSLKGYYRVDELDISGNRKDGENTIFVLVAGYQDKITSQAEPFFQAEIVVDGEVTAATGWNFTCTEVPWHVQKAPRFSKSRAFAEIWKIDQEYSSLYRGIVKNEAQQIVLPDKHLLKRNSKCPRYAEIDAHILTTGKIAGCSSESFYVQDQKLDFLKPSAHYKSFKQDEIACLMENELRSFQTLSYDAEINTGNVNAYDFSVYDFGKNVSGFIGLDVTVFQDTVLYLTFDEVQIRGDIHPFRLNCMNAMKLEMKAGVYRFESFEPYMFRYIKLMVISAGSIRIERLYAREVSYPVDDPVQMNIVDSRIINIYRAGCNTFRYNAIGLLMSCPSRERDGLLYHSFFAAMAENTITGENALEHDLLENFLLSDKLYKLSWGLEGSYIHENESAENAWEPPMWLVIELYAYRKRSGDKQLAVQYQDKIYKLIKYFKKYENRDGFLYTCDANSAVNTTDPENVQYPVNMLYCAMLDAVGSLFEDTGILLKVAKMRKTLMNQAFHDGFFIDQKTNGRATERCQYYAVLCGIATRDSMPGFLKCLENDFSQKGKKAKVCPQVLKNNDYLTQFLRFYVLSKEGYTGSVLEDLCQMYGKQAGLTYTLGENNDETASCCHGFASYAVSLITNAIQ